MRTTHEPGANALRSVVQTSTDTLSEPLDLKDPITMRTNLVRRFSATVALAAAALSLGANLPAHASTAPGSCDFGAPEVPDFVCIDSDDLGVKVGPAHTDNGIFSDDLDVDWYDQIGAAVRRVRVRGSIFLDAGAVGRVSYRVRCLDASGGVIDSATGSYASNSSFHGGHEAPVDLSCRGADLKKVDVKITFEDFGGTRSNSRSASYRAN